jgi:D-threo-aldose 1-dehydrogenase
LQRLGLDRVDIALVHDPDDYLDQTIVEALTALVRLRDEGIISAVGVGMNAVEPLRRIVDQADVDCVMVAGRWTLLDRSAEPLLADCDTTPIAEKVWTRLMS